MCLSPKWVFKRGRYEKNSYRGTKGELYEVGTYSKCGACEVCIAEKANNWVIRNYYESKVHTEKCFITLTYRESPIILVRKDIQDFIKRFRTYLDRNENKKKIRIFYAGEYGERNNRPHAHLIIYGWTDKNAQYLDVNKKFNILLKSKIIEEIWGLGRTSYQEFNTKEIPYISLYNTPQQEFKKAYKLNREKLKKLKEYAINKKGLTKGQRENLIKELKEQEKKLEESKKEYITIKEFNGWSLAMGWESFYTEYAKMPVYTFTEYIEDSEYVTPTPWVKKLANMGDFQAIKEMFRREELINAENTEIEEINKNKYKLTKKKKNDIIEWKDTKDQLEEL